MSLKEKESRRAKALEHDLSLIVPIARRLARKAGRQGVTVANVRNCIENGRFLYAFSDRAYLSRLFGAVMIRAGLERVSGRYVRTPRVGKRGGNLCGLWRAA